MTKSLLITPGFIDFGTVKKDDTAFGSLVLRNIGTEDVTITSITASTYFEWVGSAIPLVLAPGQESADVDNVKFLPTILGYITGFLYIEGDFTRGGKTRIALSGWSAADPTKLLAVDPSALFFPHVKSGEATDYKSFRISNIGEGPITLRHPVNPALDAAVYENPYWDPHPDNPPLVSTILYPGNNRILQVRFKPTGIGAADSATAIKIYADIAAPGYIAVRCAGTGETVGGPVVGGEDKYAILAFSNGPEFLSSCKQAEGSNLDCEEIQSTEKLLNFMNPGIGKSLEVTYFKYEDLNDFSVIMQALTRNQNSYKTYALTSARRDNAVIQGYTEHTIEGEMIDFIIYKEPTTGPFSLTEIIFKYKEAQVNVGTAALPFNVTSSKKVLLTNIPTLACFTDVENVSKAKVFDIGNWDTEEEQSFIQVTNYSTPGVEKALYKYYMTYEDIDLATATMSLWSTYQISSQTLSFGRKTDYGEPRGETIPDPNIEESLGSTSMEGEVLRYTFSKSASSGMISLTQWLFQLEEFKINLGAYPFSTPVVSVNTVSATGPEDLLTGNALLSFYDAGAGPFAVTVKKADSSDWGTEEIHKLIKIYDFGDSGASKSLAALYVKHDNIDVSTLDVEAYTINETKTTSLFLGSLSHLDYLLQERVELRIEGEFIQITFTGAALSGQKSINSIIFQDEPFVVLTGTAPFPAVVSVNNVTDADITSLLAFIGISTCEMRLFSEFDEEPEEEHTFKHYTDFGETGISKTLDRVFIKADDVGQGVLTLGAWTERDYESQNVIIGNTPGTQEVVTAQARLPVEGEFVKITGSGATGPKSITQFLFQYEPNVVGRDTFPTVVSANKTSELDITALFSFSGGVRSCDSTSLDCEEDGYVRKLADYEVKGFEKTLYSYRFKYEDYGIAALTAVAKSRKQSESAAVVSIGTLAADKFILPGGFDVIISEELIEILLSRTASSGPVSLTEFLSKIEPRGEEIK